jgi:phosphoglycolate phosphatase
MHTNRYKLIIFDFDGTLADSFGCVLRLFDVAALRHGLRRVDPGDVDSLLSKDPKDIMRHLGIPAWKLPLVVASMRREMRRDIDRVRLFPGVTTLLDGLWERGVALALVTSNSHDNVRCVLGPEMTARFRFFDCGVAVLGKRARLRKIVARSGLAREEIFCIGDEIRDLEAARKERLAFGAVSWGFAKPDLLAASGPDVLFMTPEEIMSYCVCKKEKR